MNKFEARPDPVLYNPTIRVYVGGQELDSARMAPKAGTWALTPEVHVAAEDYDHAMAIVKVLDSRNHVLVSGCGWRYMSSKAKDRKANSEFEQVWAAMHQMAPRFGSLAPVLMYSIERRYRGLAAGQTLIEQVATHLGIRVLGTHFVLQGGGILYLTDNHHISGIEVSNDKVLIHSGY